MLRLQAFSPSLSAPPTIPRTPRTCRKTACLRQRQALPPPSGSTRAKAHRRQVTSECHVFSRPLDVASCVICRTSGLGWSFGVAGMNFQLSEPAGKGDMRLLRQVMLVAEKHDLIVQKRAAGYPAITSSERSPDSLMPCSSAPIFGDRGMTSNRQYRRLIHVHVHEYSPDIFYIIGRA